MQSVFAVLVLPKLLLQLIVIAGYCKAIFKDEMCGGLVTTFARNITTPNYPRSYPMNKMCEWVITVPGDGKVSLTFDTFKLESDFFCRFDSVLIRDGDRYNSPLIGLFCGYNKPPTITSSSSSLLILFRSDSSISYPGFKARWRKVVTGDTMITRTPLKLLTRLDKCGGELIGTGGTFTSPGFPSNYPISVQCDWYITVPRGFEVELIFSFFRLEHDVSCRYDFVEIKEVKRNSGKHFGKYCGSISPVPLTFSSNSNLIRFYSDDMITASGFQAVWRAKNATVFTAGVLRSASTSFSSSNTEK